MGDPVERPRVSVEWETRSKDQGVSVEECVADAGCRYFVEKGPPESIRKRMMIGDEFVAPRESSVGKGVCRLDQMGLSYRLGRESIVTVMTSCGLSRLLEVDGAGGCGTVENPDRLVGSEKSGINYNSSSETFSIVPTPTMGYGEEKLLWSEVKRFLKPLYVAKSVSCCVHDGSRVEVHQCQLLLWKSETICGKCRSAENEVVVTDSFEEFCDEAKSYSEKCLERRAIVSVLALREKGIPRVEIKGESKKKDLLRWTYVVLRGIACKGKLHDEETRGDEMLMRSTVVDNGWEIVQVTTNKVNQIPERLKMAQDRQKMYVNKRRKSIKFQIGDMVMLKVSSWKGVIRFGKKGKLRPRYVGPFPITKRVGEVAYKLDLPADLRGVHPVFQVSNLKKCLAESDVVILLEDVHIDERRSFVEEPVAILDRKEKKLRNKEISLVKELLKAVDEREKRRSSVFFNPQGGFRVLGFLRSTVSVEWETRSKDQGYRSNGRPGRKTKGIGRMGDRSKDQGVSVEECVADAGRKGVFLCRALNWDRWAEAHVESYMSLAQ
ncbi:hypothetical protein L6452_15540 [Arctium lappa]|uniref:Uncharacterized protein n=1 Tax=Arctium lappa TaxID=4217 RepID=A0ACB9CNZ6_ARCLA|nr:hypothetical protein L6452_15540 [Arctium lappa]